MPSGSTTEKGFPGDNGFGHEEWNFQVTDTWNGYVFPYTYLVPQQIILDKNKGTFDIGFFSRHQEQNKWIFIGIHRNAQLIEDDEYPKIIKSFSDEEIFARRADELFSATARFKTYEDALKEVTDAFRKPYIRIKSPVSDIEFFPQPIPIEKPSNHRFKSFTYVDRFPASKIKSHDSKRSPSALAEDGYYRESPSNLKRIIPKHNKLSNRFCRWLITKGISAKQEENYIDIIFEVGNENYMAELKIVYGVGTTKAIRESLGQLLEYNHYPGRHVKGKWLIVLDQKPMDSDFKYIDNLRTERYLPVFVGWQAEADFHFYPKWEI
jgi:hypothetical protein